MTAGLSRHQRRQEHDARARIQSHQLVHHLIQALTDNRLPALITMRGSDSGKQQPQVVIDFRNRPNGGPGVVACGFLLNGNGWGKTFNKIHVRLFHALQKLARISGEGFHITSLAFGIQGIEGQRGFSGSRQAGDHDQPVSGNIHINILQVVLSGAANSDAIRCHRDSNRINTRPRRDNPSGP